MLSNFQMTEMNDIKDLSKIYVIIYVRFNFQRYSLLSVVKDLFFIIIL